MNVEHEQLAENLFLEILAAMQKNPNEKLFSFTISKANFPFELDEQKIKQILEKRFPSEFKVETFDGIRFDFKGRLKSIAEVCVDYVLEKNPELKNKIPA